MSKVAAVACPGKRLVDIDVVVVAKLVTLSDKGVTVVQVVLHLVRTWCVCAYGVCIDVVERCSSEQVVHCLVVLGVACCQQHSNVPFALLVKVCVEY